MLVRTLLIAMACMACDGAATSTSNGPAGVFSNLGTPGETSIRVRSIAPGYWQTIVGSEVWVFEIVSGRDASARLSFGAPNQKLLQERLGAYSVNSTSEELALPHFAVKRGVPFLAYARLGQVPQLAHCFSDVPPAADWPSRNFSCADVELGLLGADGSMTGSHRTIYRASSPSRRGVSWRAAPASGWTDHVVKDRIILAKSVMAPEEDGVPEVDASLDNFRVMTGGKPVDLANWNGIADSLTLTLSSP